MRPPRPARKLAPIHLEALASGLTWHKNVATMLERRHLVKSTGARVWCPKRRAHYWRITTTPLGSQIGALTRTLRRLEAAVLVPRETGGES